MALLSIINYMENALSVHSLFAKYLMWCAKHRAPRSVEWYEGHIKGFLKHLGDEAHSPASGLKPYHVVEWVDSHERWGGTYKRGAIVAIQRAFNWAEELGHIEASPIKKIKKPQASRRDNHMRPEGFQTFLDRISPNDPFRDLLRFVWHSGCRPQEVRHIEPRHVDLANERIVFPILESKGKRTKRIIYLQGVTLEIITRLVNTHPEGNLFRNKRGGAWTKYALCNRMHRLSIATGVRYALYDSRHGFAHRKLVQGIDHLTVAELLGHSDGTMLAKVYAHLDRNDAHLKRALID